VLRECLEEVVAAVPVADHLIAADQVHQEELQQEELLQECREKHIEHIQHIELQEYTPTSTTELVLPSGHFTPTIMSTGTMLQDITHPYLVRHTMMVMDITSITKHLDIMNIPSILQEEALLVLL